MNSINAAMLQLAEGYMNRWEERVGERSWVSCWEVWFGISENSMVQVGGFGACTTSAADDNKSASRKVRELESEKDRSKERGCPFLLFLAA
jgi:hypothetical protein